MTTKHEGLWKKQERRNYLLLTAGHRHRRKLNGLAIKLEARAKLLTRGRWIFGVGIVICWMVVLHTLGQGFLSSILPIIYLVVLLIIDHKESMLSDRASLLRVDTPGEKLCRDSRAPVLYLRSFDRDAEASHIYASVHDFSTTGTPQQMKLVKTTTGSEEDHITQFFDQVGPVVAIGDPNDMAPTIGAARYYMNKGDNWQDVAETLIHKASMVLLHAGRTDGLLWELEMVIQKIPPERIIVLSSFTRSEFHSFRVGTTRFFPSPLPDYPSGSTLAHFFVPCSIRACIHFDADWTPHIICMPWRFSDILGSPGGGDYLTRVLPIIFRPFLSRLNALNAQKPLPDIAPPENDGKIKRE